MEPPTQSELSTWKSLPFDREEFLVGEVTAKALTGLEDRSIYERVWALPTFEIHGIRGGFVAKGPRRSSGSGHGQGQSPSGAGQEFEKVGRELERTVAGGAGWADAKVTLLHGGDPVQVDVDHPAFEILDEAFEEVDGRKAVQVGPAGPFRSCRSWGFRRTCHPDRHWLPG